MKILYVYGLAVEQADKGSPAQTEWSLSPVEETGTHESWSAAHDKDAKGDLRTVCVKVGQDLRQV